MARLQKFHKYAVSIADCNAMLTSAICHLVAMIALGAMIAVGQPGPKPVTLIASPADSQAVLPDSTPLSAEPFAQQAEANGAAAATGPIRLFDALALAAPDVAPLAQPTFIELSAIESGRSGNAPGGLEEAEGHFARGVSQFFGVNGYGQTFVYVVDCSGSMRDNGKLERAKYELIHSIEQLSADQKYFVLFYNYNAIPMDANAPVEANEQSFARTRRWVDLVEAGGGTNPLPALLAALSIKPDAIFFLSDGLFDDSTSRIVRASNRRGAGKVPIHSIAFVSRENLGLMRAIARDSGGEFRFVK